MPDRVLEASPQVVLDVHNVSHEFAMTKGLLAPKRTLRAVDGVSFSLRRGEILGVVGESGCGKSTLARILLGIIKPTAGHVSIQGRSVASLPRRELARLVQPVFQDPYASLNPRKTIGEILELPLRVHGDDTSAQRSRKVSEAMEQVGLSDRLRQAPPNQLSGGQRQRVAIARALIVRPQIVICDEPTSALDVSVQAQILNLLIDLQRTFSLTLVFISHNLSVVEHLSTHVAVMYLGRVVEQAAVGTLFETPRHPYTQTLLASILAPDPYAGLPRLTASSVMPSPMAPPSGCTFHPRCPHAEPACSVQRPALRTIERTLVACDLAT